MPPGGTVGIEIEPSDLALFLVHVEAIIAKAVLVEAENVTSLFGQNPCDLLIGAFRLAPINGNLIALVQQSLYRFAFLVDGDATHGDSCRFSLYLTSCQGQAQRIRCFHRILFKELIEVSGTNHDDVVGVLLLHLLVFLPSIVALDADSCNRISRQVSRLLGLFRLLFQSVVEAILTKPLHEGGKIQFKRNEGAVEKLHLASCQ